MGAYSKGVIYQRKELNRVFTVLQPRKIGSQSKVLKSIYLITSAEKHTLQSGIDANPRLIPF